MLVALNWLSEYCPAVKPDELATLLTDHGLEVESQGPAGLALAGIIAAKVVSVKPIKGANKLKLCEVDDNSGSLRQVVCGAPNVKAHVLFAFAPVGTILLDGNQIQAKKVFGVQSEGMLCSASELGISGLKEVGIMQLDRNTAVGTPVDQLLDLAEVVLDLSITPNRGDWLSIYGIAREVGALLETKVKPLRVTAPKGGDTKVTPAIAVDAIQACPRFCCLPISGVKATAQTPHWMIERLRRCGVRPVSLIVNVTNYVMLETGQPLHAFDHDKLSGKLNVRWAKQGEKLKLIDGTEATLSPNYLTVCGGDEVEALAGVMGGLTSSVTDQTSNIVLEAAHFAPSAIRGKTRELNISSEAAFRFERGVDPQLCHTALALAARLICKIAGGSCSQIQQAGDIPSDPEPIELPVDAVERIIGIKVSQNQASAILRRLGFKVAKQGKSLFATTPSWRFDIERTEDLVEEVIRVLGYEQVPITMPTAPARFLPQPERLLSSNAAKHQLAAEGFSELVTYSFTKPEWEKDFYANTKPHTLINPLAEGSSALRSGMLASLVDRTAYNLNRKVQTVKIFELSRCFPTGDQQPVKLAGLATGPLVADHWDRKADRQTDYYDLKGVVERLLNGIELEFTKIDHPALHPNRASQILLAGKLVGIIGELHPALQQQFEIEHRCGVFELDYSALSKIERKRQAVKLSVLPLVRRDLALLTDLTIEAAQLVATVNKLAIPEIFGATIFDSYSGDKLPEGKKSIGLRLTLQGKEENLVEVQINQIVAEVAQTLQQKFSTTVRS